MENNISSQIIKINEIVTFSHESKSVQNNKHLIAIPSEKIKEY